MAANTYKPHGQMLHHSVCRLLHSLAAHWDGRNREKPLGMLHQKGLEGVFQISVDSTVSLERKGKTNMDRSDVDGRILRRVLKKSRLESQVRQSAALCSESTEKHHGSFIPALRHPSHRRGYFSL
jgi:hypothetical protein